MTPTSLDRTMHRCRSTWLLLILLLNAASPASPLSVSAEENEAPGTGQARMEITLFARPDAHGDPPHLQYALIVNTSVVGDETHREARAPLGENVRLHSFAPYEDDVHGEPETTSETDEGGTWAVATWTDDGPPAGSPIAMLLEGRQDIATDQEIPVRWDRLPENITSVRILLPPNYTPSVDPDHDVERETAVSGRIPWNITKPPSRHIGFTIQSLEDVKDPALAAPPPAWGTYAVFAALALLSAGAWFLGKKSEARGKKRDPPQPPG